MRIEIKPLCRTEALIRQVDRENRAIWLRCTAKRIRLAIQRALWEVLRFLALSAGTGLFACIIVPAMELQPERTLVIAEMLAVLAFGVWLGGWIYEPKKRK